MEKIRKSSIKFNTQTALLVAIVVALVLAIFTAYQYRVLGRMMSSLEADNSKLSADLAASRDENNYLLEQNREKQEIIDSFQGQISEITSTVGTLEKLARTDEELLKKYSKVYFLNENYVPYTFAEIDKEYTYNGGANFLMHGQVWPYLKRLLDQAKREDVDLLVASAYRSFGTQAALKQGYSVTYGSGANQFSADQGYSEHQLGTSLDFTTSKSGAMFSQFASTPAYDWLLDNAHNYGFILSYPENNTYYKFEPWHWRFVGVSLATHLHEEGKHFYDLSQREIDEYLVKLFD